VTETADAEGNKSDKSNITDEDQNISVRESGIGEKESINTINILFEYDKSSFTEPTIIELNKLLRLMRNNAEQKIEIWGHTDNKGNAEYNLALSFARSEAVKKFIVTHGIDDNRIQCYGYGSSIPKADNNTIE